MKKIAKVIRKLDAEGLKAWLEVSQPVAGGRRWEASIMYCDSDGTTVTYGGEYGATMEVAIADLDYKL